MFFPGFWNDGVYFSTLILLMVKYEVTYRFQPSNVSTPDVFICCVPGLPLSVEHTIFACLSKCHMERYSKNHSQLFLSLLGTPPKRPRNRPQNNPNKSTSSNKTVKKTVSVSLLSLLNNNNNNSSHKQITCSYR